MNARNFDKLMQEQIAQAHGEKPKLLLHCCCAPCASACLERLQEFFETTVLFYNPNIEGDEYERRKAEIKRFIEETGFADFIDSDHDEKEFYCTIKGLENEKEGGARCEKCFELRLAETARTADENGFDYFTTTLTISPLKNAKIINEIGEKLQNKAKWLYSDFKKRNGYLRSTELSQQHDLYRQNYCGCVFSRRDAQSTQTLENRKKL